MKNVIIVIPVYNEGEVILKQIKNIKKLGFKSIILVDDGSTDDTESRVRNSKIVYIRHAINCGKGSAIKTGIQAAKMYDAEYVVTMDGDGQHNPVDITKLVKKAEKGFDVVLGYRPLSNKSMPFTRSIMNYFANILVWALYGVRVKDSQSGFRCYNKNSLKLIETRDSRYEYDSIIINEIKKHNLKFAEVPISVRYTKYSMSKKEKQNLSNAIYTFYKLFSAS